MQQETDADADLMLAFAAGDESAFDGLFRRWASPLLRYLERMVGDTATAEELVQETFLRVHGARGRYEPRARFSTWLYRIATRLALNELRRPRRRHPHAEDVVVDLPAPTHGSDEIADSRRASFALERELARLPERQRVALWLAAAEGRSYAEVAAVLDTSELSVKSLVHRGRARLVERLARSRTAGAHGERS